MRSRVLLNLKHMLRAAQNSGGPAGPTGPPPPRLWLGSESRRNVAAKLFPRGRPFLRANRCMWKCAVPFGGFGTEKNSKVEPERPPLPRPPTTSVSQVAFRRLAHSSAQRCRSNEAKGRILENGLANKLILPNSFTRVCLNPPQNKRSRLERSA